MGDRTRIFYTYSIGVVGTTTASLSSMSVENWAHVSAILAGLGTFAWMVVQCYLGLRQRACFRNDCHRRVTTRK